MQPYFKKKNKIRLGISQALTIAISAMLLIVFNISISIAEDQPVASIEGGITEQVRDTNNNGKYDSLEIIVNFLINKTGNYTLRGWIASDSGETIDSAEAAGSYTAGKNSARLVFDGKNIAQARYNGPYKLESLILTDSNEEAVDSQENAYSTRAYAYTDFETGNAVLTGFSDSPSDADQNGFYDSLKIQVSVKILSRAIYNITGELVDKNGNAISGAEIQADFSTVSVPGQQSVILEFPGNDIFNSGIDGPYFLKNVCVIGNGFEDQFINAHTTQAYRYQEFAEQFGIIDNPSIPSDAAGVSVKPTLGWDEVSGATSYDIYIWRQGDTKPTEPTATGLTTPQYVPQNSLLQTTAYQWQIIAENSFGKVTGPEWMFTTNVVKIGDINGDEQVNLSDVILTLQILSGISVSETLIPEADVNGDGKIGLEEVVYILQVVSELRP